MYQLHRHSAAPCKTAPKIYPRVGSSKIFFLYWPPYFVMVSESFTVKNLSFPRHRFSSLLGIFLMLFLFDG